MLLYIMKVGICGLGFVGQAIYSFLNNMANESAECLGTVVYDKYKKINSLDALVSTDLVYICIPTPYEHHAKSYNMSEIDATLALFAKLAYKGVILIKSTVLPDYCATMNKIYPELKIIHNPEFLSAATAAHDFANQRHIILGYTLQSQSALAPIETFYKTLFPGALISVTSSYAAGLTKLACNSFYATKVQFFTELFLLCDKIDTDYEEVKKLMLNNEWIHPMHTSVPGPDGQVSFGGACLPKDINALNQYMILNKTHNGVLESVIEERNGMRSD
jgi:GDP-mannose 6-dehydrogenase